MYDEDVDPKIDLYTTHIAEELGERGRYQFSPSLVAERDLQRFYYYLRPACPTFTLGEARALVSALDTRRQDLPPLGHRTLFPNVDPPLLWAYVAEARERN